MKKWLCICLSVLLCLPCLFLSVCADDVQTVSVIFTSSQSGYSSFTLNGDIYTLQQGQSITLSVSYDSLNTIVSSRNIYVDDSLTQTLSTSSLDPTIFDASDDLHFYLKSSVSEMSTYFFVNSPPVPPSPYEDLGVDDGVGESINYAGQVLDFLFNNSTILFLVGLSIAMFAVVPSGIRLIKQIIKGY